MLRCERRSRLRYSKSHRRRLIRLPRHNLLALPPQRRRSTLIPTSVPKSQRHSFPTATGAHRLLLHRSGRKSRRVAVRPRRHRHQQCCRLQRSARSLAQAAIHRGLADQRPGLPARDRSLQAPPPKVRSRPINLRDQRLGLDFYTLR